MRLRGWGRHPEVEAELAAMESPKDALCFLEQGPCIAHGLGRSYGDSALAPRALLTRRMSCLLDFDPEAGEVTCEAGLSLDQLLRALLPRGWFLPVTPGTRHVTLGGAIASDVHGKNHHLAGCFSQHVRWLELLQPDGRILRCSPEENASWFRATCGGMGLTGIILAARLQLRRVPSAFINQTLIKARNLREAFELFSSHSQTAYTVAWIDCLARGDALGRSLFMAGEHSDRGPLRLPEKRPLTVPCELPGWALSGGAMRLFNSLYYWRVRGRQHLDTVPLQGFFYPLDALGQWNRLYGKRGFVQYQCVLPLEASYEGLRRIVQAVAESGSGSFLAVLKLFGEANENYLSFPMRGYTLALDFKLRPALLPLLDRLDAMVLDCGGRLYLSKDARMGAAMLEKGYPGLDAFTDLRSRHGLRKGLQSLQSQRLEL